MDFGGREEGVGGGGGKLGKVVVDLIMIDDVYEGKPKGRCVTSVKTAV